MKKIFLLIPGLVLCLSCKAQQTLNLDSSVSIELPNKAERVTKEQTIEHANKKFKNDVVILKSMERRSFKNTYKVDDVIISLFTDHHAVKEGQLSAIKKGLDEMSKDDKTYKSVINTVNERTILITTNVFQNIAYCNFFSFNKKNSMALTGLLEFNETDSTKAKIVLNQIFKSIKFKD